MSDTPPPKRRTLSLPNRPAPPPPPPEPEPAAVAPQPGRWVCKPCGKRFDPPLEGEDEDAVRCPNCNARLGKLGGFRAEEPPSNLRARRLPG